MKINAKIRNALSGLFLSRPDNDDTVPSLGPKAGLTMWDIIDTWIQSRRSVNTRRHYGATLREFCSVLKIERTPDGWSRLCQATVTDVTLWVSWCRNRPAQPGRSASVSDFVSEGTVRSKVERLYAVYQYLVETEHVTKNPALRARRELRHVVGNDRRPHPVIPREKIAELQELDFGPDAADRRDQAIMAVLFGGALRRFEAIALRLVDIRFDAAGEVRLHLRNTKRQRAEHQALPPWAQEILRAFLVYRRAEGAADSDPLFVRYVSGEPLAERFSEKTFYRNFKRILGRVGAEEFSPHSARVTAITRACRKFSHEQVAKYSRHSSVAMVARYDKPESDLGANVAAELDYLDENRADVKNDRLAAKKTAATVRLMTVKKRSVNSGS